MSKRPNPYGPEVEPDAEGSPSIPLWVAGRAFLTMPGNGFFDLRDRSGRVYRRVPLCDATVLDPLISSSLTPAPMSAAAWQGVVESWRNSLQGYSAHFVGLLREEGGAAVNAEAELASAIDAFSQLRAPAPMAGLVAVVATAEQPFAAPARLVLQALAGGQSVVLKPSVRCPSALLAFAELGTRAGLSDGRLNVVHGDEPIVAALCARPEISAISCPPGGAAAEAIASMARAAGKLA